MKKILTYLLLLITFKTYTQTTKFDTIIQTKIYHSYFSTKLNQPVFTVNYLDNGGGDCSRAKFRFKNDKDIKMLNGKFYKGSGFDRGHLVSAEDFAFDCELDELTFRYYNCSPQTPNLNRGEWKKWESRLRDISKYTKLLIISGGIWNGDIYPNKMFKIVYNLESCNIMYVILFTNVKKNSQSIQITLEELESLTDIKFDSIISRYW